jgi:anion-transporting  ArsA/GET3 family ATPase
LLIECDSKGDLPSLFDHAPVGFVPELLADGIHGLAMDTEDALAEYLKIYARVPLIGKLGPFARMLEFVGQAAPGVREILVVGKICYEVKQSLEARSQWDLIVVDAAASGHVVSQLGAARTMQRLIQVGSIRGQLEWMEAILGDPELAAMVVVCTPEEMPIAETIGLVNTARADLSIQVSHLVMNRRIPDVFTAAERPIFDRLRTSSAQRSVSQVVGSDPNMVFQGVALFDDICQEQAAHEAELRAALPDIPTLVLPAFFVRDSGTRAMRRVSRALAQALAISEGRDAPVAAS